MRRHLKRWLDNSELLKTGGSYDGIIADVVEETVRNRYTAQRQIEPVIVFTDGWRLIPNIGMRRALVEMLGEETDDWVGVRIRVFLRRVVPKNGDGETREKYNKFVECLDPPGLQRMSAPEETQVEALTAADIEWENER